MPTVGTSSSGHFSCASATQHSLRDLRTKRKGQPVFVMGHVLERKGQEATFEVFNDRLAVVKFADGVAIGYDPTNCSFRQTSIRTEPPILKSVPAPNANNSFR